MLTGAIVLRRAMVVAALALSASALSAATAHAAAAPVSGQSCTTEEWVWTGSVVFDETVSTYDTGLVVPVQAGTELTVVGVSADGLTQSGEARVMTVTVGGVVARAGQKVPGGTVAIVGDGAPAQVGGATVVVDRCAQVQSNASGASLPRTGAGLNSALLGGAVLAAGSATTWFSRRSRRPEGSRA
jgi:LPXTG-motif cell wall-anchored protein